MWFGAGRLGGRRPKTKERNTQCSYAIARHTQKSVVEGRGLRALIERSRRSSVCPLQCRDLEAIPLHPVDDPGDWR